MKPELLLDARATLGEGPAWDAPSGLLTWVDIYAGDLHLYAPDEATDTVLDVGGPLGCAAPTRDRQLVLAHQGGIARLEFFDDLIPLANPEAHLPGNRFNDGKCDPAGRFLVGSMDNAEVEASGSLYSLHPDGSLHTLLSGLRISNGLTWSPDHQTFYFIDTPTRMVTAYDYDLATGDIANPRTVVRVPEALGWPDGMTSDAQGKLWIALWGGAAVTRWDPATGALLETIHFPALNVSSCVFGGADLTDLYVTSARKGTDEAALAQYPFSGGLFRVRTKIEGMPTFAFGG